LDKPLVSVVITSFNRLEELKESVLRTKRDTTYSNIEIVIVDGGSTDGSAEFIESIDEENIFPVVLGMDKGSAYSHSKGMEFAKGKYVITIDDDCYLKPKSVETMVKIFEKYENLAIIGFGLVNPNIVDNSHDYWDDISVVEDIDNYTNEYQTMNYGSACGYRKSVLDKIGCMNYDWSWSSRTEDIELNIRAISNGYNSVMIPEIVAYHKVSPSNRPNDVLTMNGIHGTIWILLKYYPFLLRWAILYKVLGYCIYFSIINNNLIYMRAVIRSFEKSNKMLANKPKLRWSIAKKIHLPTIWLFSIGSDSKWAGE
jgi:GT2 family glycosyltransferase